MASFIRSIPETECGEYIEAILERQNHFIPLRSRPKRARPGDFIYLAYKGVIVGRAVMRAIERGGSVVPVGADQRPYDAEWLVKYQGGWQRPPQPIPFRGRQGIRYLGTMGLQGLDSQRW